MKDYKNKEVREWNLNDVEDYFKEITNPNQEINLRVITSTGLNDYEDLQLQSLVAYWYFKKDLPRKDAFIEDLMKAIKSKTTCEDFLLQIYMPVGNIDTCFSLKFDAIFKEGILQIGNGTFQELLVKGVNNYLTNAYNANGMIVVKGINKNKVVSIKSGENTYKVYEAEYFHFMVEKSVLHGVNQEGSAKIQEYDFKTNEYIGREHAIQYIDTTELVAEFEVDNLVFNINYNHLNH